MTTFLFFFFFFLIPPLRILVFMDGMYFICTGQAIIV